MFYPKRLALTIAALILTVGAGALEISAFRTDKNGEAEISFCGKFKIVYVALAPARQGWQLEMPVDWGGYKNLFLTSEELSTGITKCFQGSCVINKKACKPVYEVLSGRKVSENSVLFKVSFDKQLTVVFFVNKHMREGKDYYRFSAASDFKFTDSGYRSKLRSFLIGQAKTLL